MNEILFPITTTYWIFYNNEQTIIHYGQTNSNQTTTSGLDNQEIFTEYNLYLERLSELNIDADG